MGMRVKNYAVRDDLASMEIGVPRTNESAVRRSSHAWFRPGIARISSAGRRDHPACTRGAIRDRSSSSVPRLTTASSQRSANVPLRSSGGAAAAAVDRRTVGSVSAVVRPPHRPGTNRVRVDPRQRCRSGRENRDQGASMETSRRREWAMVVDGLAHLRSADLKIEPVSRGKGNQDTGETHHPSAQGDGAVGHRTPSVGTERCIGRCRGRASCPRARRHGPIAPRVRARRRAMHRGPRARPWLRTPSGDGKSIG